MTISDIHESHTASGPYCVVCDPFISYVNPCIVSAGLADEIRNLFRVAWCDQSDPDKGFKYLYLTPEHFMKVSDSVRAELIEDDGESRYKITDIIGTSALMI